MKSRKNSKNNMYCFFENLLQVTLRNDCYLFDLDQSSDTEGLHPKEVDFVQNTDQLLHLNGFVDAGICHQAFYDKDGMATTILSKLATNENNSLYFKETK